MGPRLPGPILGHNGREDEYQLCRVLEGVGTWVSGGWDIGGHIPHALGSSGIRMGALPVHMHMHIIHIYIYIYIHMAACVYLKCKERVLFGTPTGGNKIALAGP